MTKYVKVSDDYIKVIDKKTGKVLGKLKIKQKGVKGNDKKASLAENR